MQGRRVNQLLSLLNPLEQENFLRWISFEWGDKQVYVRRLADILILTPSASTADIWSALYPTEPYNDARLRKLSRDLASWVEQYLVRLQLAEETDQQDLLLLEALRGRGGAELYDTYYRKIERKKTQQPIRNVSYYRNRLQREEGRQRFLTQYDSAGQAKDTLTLNYHLDQWWMLHKLEMACLNALYVRMYGELPEEVMLPEMLNFLDGREEYLESPLAAVYIQIYALLKGDESGTDAIVLASLEAAGDAFSLQDQRNMFNLLLSHYIGAMNQDGGKASVRRLFELYQWGIKKQLVLHEGQLSANQYLNILSVCLRARETEAAWTYLHSLKSYLPAEEQASVSSLGMGMYHFTQKEFSAVLASLSQIRFSQIFREIQARVLLLQAYYECHGNGDEWLHDQLDSFIRYLRSQKLSPSHKQAYLNRFRLFRRMIKARSPRELEKLRALIDQTHPLDNPAWLIEKVEERLARQT